MPPVTPRRKTKCSSHAVAVPGRVEEPATGPMGFLGFALLAPVLVAAHWLVQGLSWSYAIVPVVLDLGWLLLLWGAILERREPAPARSRRGYARLADGSFNLGGTLTFHVGTDRGLADLEAITVSLSCVRMIREYSESSGEREKTCYVVWQDGRRVAKDELPQSGEIEIKFELPLDPKYDYATLRGLDEGPGEQYWTVSIALAGRGLKQIPGFRVLVNHAAAPLAVR